MKFLNLERRIIPNHKQRRVTKRWGKESEEEGRWKVVPRRPLLAPVRVDSLLAAWFWFLFIGRGNHIPGVFEALIFTK